MIKLIQLLIEILIAVTIIFILLYGFMLITKEETDYAIQFCETHPKEIIKRDIEISCDSLLKAVYGKDYCNLEFINCQFNPSS